MNYLELCQAVVREGAIVGGDNKPTTVEGQTGRMRLVVDWVARANRDVQSFRNDFSFRIRAIDFAIPAMTEVIRPIDTHADVESINELSVSVRDQNEATPIGPVHWTNYRSQRLNPPDPVTTLPTQFSISTSGDIHVIPRSTRDCILRCEVKLAPQIMTLDADVPYIPEGYHDVIIYRALMYFYEYEESMTQFQMIERRYIECMEKLVAATTNLSDWNTTQTGDTLMVMACD